MKDDQQSKPFRKVARKAAKHLAALVDHPECPRAIAEEITDTMNDLLNAHGPARSRGEHIKHWMKELFD
jgi:hypothetical protein